MAIVSNSSPLIGLEQIGQINLLQYLFGQVSIPDAVAAEIEHTVSPRSWIYLRSLSRPIHKKTVRPALGSGEREAISLAIEIGASAIILDDEAARDVAGELGLPVIGTAGILVVAKEKKLIQDVKTHLDALKANRFFLSEHVYELILRKAGEL